MDEIADRDDPRYPLSGWTSFHHHDLPRVAWAHTYVHGIVWPVEIQTIKPRRRTYPFRDLGRRNAGHVEIRGHAATVTDRAP